MFDFGPMLDAARGEMERQQAAAVRAVEQFAAVRVVGNAQELCPVETGALMASGTWSEPEVSGTRILVVVGFNVSYAMARHERPPEQDAGAKQNPKGQWKFLETALRGVAGEFAAFVGGEIKAAGGGA